MIFIGVGQKEQPWTAFIICAIQLLSKAVKTKRFHQNFKDNFLMKRVFKVMYMENMDPFQHKRQNTITSFASKILTTE